MRIDFEHTPAAHCESGVTTNMLRFYGIRISEPMVFGIGAGLFFSYMPFIRLHNMPVFSFRPLPGHIFARVTKRLGMRMNKRRFLNEDTAMKALDRLLEQGIPVGNVIGVFYLPYFPKEYRFHFNAHNICVIGKENDIYTVSDPVSQTLNQLRHDELKRVRFAKGTYPPLGKMYWVKRTPDALPDLKMRGLEKALGTRKAALQLAQLIRMLEEIGTGGAGFRYMYAAFLQEASGVTENPTLRELAMEMTVIGDRWRDFAYEGARKFKQRGEDVCSYDRLADKLTAIADAEKNFFLRLREALK